MKTIRWTIAIVLLPLTLIGGAGTVALAWRGRLPDSLPNQGGVGDRPITTTIDVDILIAILLGAALAVWVTGLVAFTLAARLSGTGRYWLRLGVQVGVGASAAAMATILLMVLGVALDAPAAVDVRISWNYFAAVVVAPMVAAGLVGLLAYLLAGKAPTKRPGSGALTGATSSVADAPAKDAMPSAAGPAADAPATARRSGKTSAAPAHALAVAPDERLLWWESRPMRPVLWLTAALALAAVVMVAVLVPVVGVVGWAAVAPAVSALALLPFANYRLTIDGEGVRVALGPLRRRVPMAAIAIAEETHLPVETWLTRSMLRGAIARDLPLLPGPALALRLNDGTRHLVTCRDVRTAVAIVNTLRARQTTI